MKPTLLVLAAGMGSRYGGLKQLDELGPYGESIIDYSVYDAIEAGFEKVVFVIRQSFADQFKAQYEPKFGDKIAIEYVYQELDNLPNGFTVPAGREKPWGTGHAMLMAKDAIQGSFAIINADDFYGREAYQAVLDFMDKSSDDNEYAMVGYALNNTLSEHGTVSRGVCETDANNNLTNIVERTKIGYLDGKIVYYEGENTTELTGKEPVSMNFWAFKNSFFEALEKEFIIFLKEKGKEMKSEFYFNAPVDKMIKEGRATAKVIACDTKWFGVTYQEDKPQVQKSIQKLIDNGVYPANLWGGK
ncbi:Nucleotidyl transferase [Saccharicrinis carchari]|uniref:Nucleotidyl transferase n=1 Tax=Saccharicrinis carchari TaxID=1168039 RepID=A0A521BHJ6_SACCC|nr:sugar phosphate nucleotidyltransferase [Saccharicrinis carchari]SMO46565.1 Nucleotidyl transferase [Saccharicrinis carchari]